MTRGQSRHGHEWTILAVQTHQPVDVPLSMSPKGTKRCFVAYALPERQYLWAVDLAPQATIRDALAAARRLAEREDVDWDGAQVGIFGQLQDRSHVPREADRIEIYRPLSNDPRQRRRERVQDQRKGRRS